MWPLSLLLLHTKLNTLFPSFIPLLEEFSFGEISVSSNKNLYSNVTRSNNDNSIYKNFKATALSKYNYDLNKQNGLGISSHYIIRYHTNNIIRYFTLSKSCRNVL
jgi:hypothetical protein